MLTLPIKKKWFDMILSGEKKEEYRKATNYYYTRFTNLFHAFNSDVKPICFRNGYSANSPSFVAHCSFSLGTGKEEWGAESDQEYYVLKIHSIEKLKEQEKYI